MPSSVGRIPNGSLIATKPAAAAGRRASSIPAVAVDPAWRTSGSVSPVDRT